MRPAPDSSDNPDLSQVLRELDVILANAGVGVVFVKARTLVRCNQRYAEIYGFADPEAAVGRSSVELYESEDEARSLGRRAYPVLAAGETFRSEQLMLRQNGEKFWAHLTGRLINPDDPAYWKGAHTVQLVQRFFPMFQLTTDGLTEAVKALVGART